MRAHSGEKIAQKSRNCCIVNGRSCGCIGNVHIPETKYKRSNSNYFVTFIALICGRVWLQLLQPLAQSLIGSPGALVVVMRLRWSLVFLIFRNMFLAEFLLRTRSAERALTCGTVNAER